MKNDRKNDLISICNGIIRNAENITKELECNQNLTVTITFIPNCVPDVEIKRTFIPKEIINLWNGSLNE